jgi:hypothetical protein
MFSPGSRRPPPDASELIRYDMSRERRTALAPDRSRRDRVLRLVWLKLLGTASQKPAPKSINVLQKCRCNKPPEAEPKHAWDDAADRAADTLLQIPNAKRYRHGDNSLSENQPIDTHYRSPGPNPRRQEYVA